MRPVTRYYESQNEYTLPLQGKPYYRNSGIIYALDRIGSKYAVSRVDFERYDDQNFQYIFSPEWSVIDTLPPSIFQGIPGLDLRLERYYRVNVRLTLFPNELQARAVRIYGIFLKRSVLTTMTALNGFFEPICAAVQTI